MRDRKFYEQMKLEGLSFTPEGWVYIGRGETENPHERVWPWTKIKTSGKSKSTSDYMLMLDSGNSGNSKQWHYFVREEDWNEKFPPEKPSVSLEFLREQVKKAETLVGNGYDRVEFILTEPSPYQKSDNVVAFFKEHGYCVVMYKGPYRIPFVEEMLVQKITVKTTNGESYIAESLGDCWKFGCAKIDKSLINSALELFKHKNGKGDRSITEIHIGKGIFTEEILQKLVDADKNLK